ncbi:hypothetical protein D3C87_1896860 [compost metagenome]
MASAMAMSDIFRSSSVVASRKFEAITFLNSAAVTDVRPAAALRRYSVPAVAAVDILRLKKSTRLTSMIPKISRR